MSRLSIELVPATCWYTNVRSNVTRKDWETCKNYVKQRSGSRCEICGGVGSRYPVDCHEIWAYDDEKQVQTLVDLIALCPPCHEVKHIGRAEALGNFDRALRHLAKVNGWTFDHAYEYACACSRVWHLRSQTQWTLDISFLKRLGITPYREGPRMTQPTEDQTYVWIKTEPSLDGKTYMVTVEIDEDRAIALTPTSAPKYAMTILSAIARAEYDAAVYHQLSKKLNMLDPKAIAQLIGDMRKDRPDIDFSPTDPLRIQPGVNSEGLPFLGVYIDGKQIGQWTMTDAREHVLVALEVCAVADLDAGYYRTLTGIVGLEEPLARNVVDDLQNFREPAE